MCVSCAVTGAEERVVLDALLDPTAPPDPRCIHEHEAPATEFHRRVEAVSRRAGDLAHDGALATDQRVQEARLPDVRPTNDRDVRIGRRLFFLLRGKAFDDRVQQVARPVALDRGDRERISQSERIELRRLRFTAPGVSFVGDEDDRFAAAAKLIGDVVLDRKIAASA